MLVANKPELDYHLLYYTYIVLNKHCIYYIIELVWNRDIIKYSGHFDPFPFHVRGEKSDTMDGKAVHQST